MNVKMIRQKKDFQVSCLFFVLVCAFGTTPAFAKLPLETIELPEGFKIELYAGNVLNARSLTLGDKGTLFVGSRSAGNVYALRDEDHDAKADRMYIIARGLNMPNGVAFRNGALYVAEIHRVIRFDDIEKRLDDPPEPVVVNDQFPRDQWHGWKFIRFSPDGKLFVPVGAPCNVCETGDHRYASIMMMTPGGRNLEVWAKGIRNTVGFDWNPETKELWFTDNGRDWAGDDFPPDELNHAPKAGMHFGFPYCHGAGVPDSEFGGRFACDEFTPVAQELGPHVAALGMRFYTGYMFPAEYHNQIFIAEHGSWNRKTPLGYRVTMVRLDKNQAVSYTIFAQGWLQNGKPWGRPVDVQVMPDGALLVSDDFANAIYRVTYGP